MMILTDDYMKRNLARAVPGARWDPEVGEQGSWVLDELAPRASAVVLKLFPHLGISHPELVESRAELLRDVRPFDRATPWVQESGASFNAPTVRGRVACQWACTADDGCREHVDSPSRPMCPIHGDTMAVWSFHPFQEIDLAYGAAVLRAHGAFYLGWERGLGKTLGALALIEDLACKRTLVVAPNSAKESVWRDEIARFLPDMRVLVLPNDKAKRERMMDNLPADEPFILVVHYEALAVIAGKKRKPTGDKTRTIIQQGWTRHGKWDLIVTDEDHRLANLKAQWTKAIKKIPHEKLLLLSGSIIQNHLEELYSPHHRAFPTRYKTIWRDWNDRFLDYVENGHAKICVGVQQAMVPAMRNELGVWMVYRRKEDELELPPVTRVTELLALSPSQRKVYDDLVESSLAELPDGKTIKAQVGIALMGKLRIVATGLDLLGTHYTDSTKLDRAVEIILDGEDDDFVGFSWYKAGVTALATRLAAKGVDAFCMTGDTPQSARTEMIARFDHGEGRVLLGTLSTMGESVNLQRANNIVRLDRSWNPMTNVQSDDRVNRQGQRRAVTITDLVARDTVDQLHVLPVLASKAALRAAILGGVG